MGQLPHEFEPVDLWTEIVDQHMTPGLRGDLNAAYLWGPLENALAGNTVYVPASAGSQEPAPAERDDDWKPGPPEPIDERSLCMNSKHRGLEAELQRVQGQLDQARKALKWAERFVSAVERDITAGYNECGAAYDARGRFKAALAASGVTEKGDGQ
jgi:hypothetical protein